MSLGGKSKFHEETSFAPHSPYAATKAGGDFLCKSYVDTFHLPVVVTHCSNNYGPYQYPEKLIPFFVLRLTEGKSVPIYGDGKNVRDWIYVEDHCAALELCLFHAEPGKVYTIGADQEMNNLEIAFRILSYFGKKKDQLEFINDRPGHDRRYAIDARKIKKELGWVPEYDFEKAFRHTLDWYVANPKWVAGVKKKGEAVNSHIAFRAKQK